MNLNCGGLNAKFEKLIIFLAECNNNFRPLSVIALQETHLIAGTDINSLQIPDYNLVYDLARINTFGGVALYVHKSFSFERLSTVQFNQTSAVYESLLLQIYNNDNKYRKYVVGSVYRRPSGLSADVTQFINEFTEVLNNLHTLSKYVYLNGDYNIDLLAVNSDNHAQSFYENVTSQGFFPKLTRPTRSCNKTGIPQGSILGPLFFSILINDIVNSTDKINFLMYADDTTLYFSLEDFETQSREAAINTEINKVNTWLRLNKLSLNVEKTKCMLFHKRRTPPVINFTINNRDIDRVAQFTFLGIILDENLTWKNHINMISNKLSKINGVLHRLKYIFPKHIMLSVYKSLFMPHMSYGSFVWGHNFDAIYKLQKKAVRTITHSHYIAHSEPLLKQLNLLNMKDMVDQKLLKFLHKLNTNKLPAYFNSYKPYLKRINTTYNLRRNPLPVPAVKHMYAESLLIYRLVKLKNTMSVKFPLVAKKLDEGSHSLAGFSNYVAKTMIDRYEDLCTNDPCLPCGRL